jgi:type IX secretion system PorP/SprF family membrane protein
MRKIWTIYVLLSLPFLVVAQQEEQFTQYMFNRPGYNPGYAGSDGGLCFTSIIRNQWIGLEGAPQSQLITVNTLLGNTRVGLGGTVMRQTIGLSEKLTLEGMYAYRIPFARGILGIGIQGSLRQFKVNFQNAIATTSIDLDGAIPGGITSKIAPNFGAGIYYDSKSFYFGISSPRLLNIDIDPGSDDLIISREVQHFYGMAGMSFQPLPGLKIQPQILLKIVQNSPIDADFNILFGFLDHLSVGVSIRTGGSNVSGIGESLSLMGATRITKNILIGIAWDSTLSELKNYSDGTIEVALRLTFGGASSENTLENVENGRIFNAY